MTAAEFIDEIGIQPGLVNFQLSISQQTVTIETLDIITFVSTTITPDIHAIFFHSGNQHGASDSAAQWGGVKVSHTSSGVMEGTTLNSGDPFSNQLFTTINQTSFLCTVLHRFARNGIIIFFIRLTQISRVGIRNCPFFLHP
ncbi:Uncharacterised protein [Yersinia enterocolitica]|nr:Uncharacterised protein [Yersinia enterocolitica]